MIQNFQLLIENIIIYNTLTEKLVEFFSGQSVVRGERHIHSDGGIHFEGRVQVFPCPWGELKQRFDDA